MESDERYQRFEIPRPPSERLRHPVVIIGAGPIGLAAAVDLAQHGIASVVLDDDNVVSIGSRAICWAKRSLEIFDRLGIGDRMLDKGVTWRVGRLFHRDREVFNFDLLPQAGHKMPAFVNLQQYYVEHYLIERAQELDDLVELRFGHRVVDHELADDGVALTVQTKHGSYQLDGDYVLACDGSRSPTRERMGLPFEGKRFEEQFLIADVRMTDSPYRNDGTPERWFWFKPPFHDGQSALLHKQPDDIYRIDLQLSPDADPELEKSPERVLPRIRAIVGEDTPFELDWVSVYRFACARLDRFVHGRMLFVGDSAHVVSPFGARGGNGGIHDVDNLCWKLAAVLNGTAPPTLIQSYGAEREHGSDENIAHSARATRFMSPESATELRYRDAVLALASSAPFARALINSGRLSTPCSLAGSALNAEAADDSLSACCVGDALVDAPLDAVLGTSLNSTGDTPAWLLGSLGGRFSLLSVDDDTLLMSDLDLHCLRISDDPVVSARYPSGTYLVRPDQHVASYWPVGAASVETVREGLDRALARQQT